MIFLISLLLYFLYSNNLLYMEIPSLTTYSRNIIGFSDFKYTKKALQKFLVIFLVLREF